MNYTWFSSVYDNDDVIFRILTFFQIFGLLVFTAGIASTMTENPNFAPVCVSSWFCNGSGQQNEIQKIAVSV
ncbi:MAG: low temperature requirement protein A [Candidatus Altimarinota bacterium]